MTWPAPCWAYPRWKGISMPRLLVTGSAGLVGSECVRHFAALGWEVWGLDSGARARYFGPGASTRPALEALAREVPGYRHFACDVRDPLGVNRALCEVEPDLLIHAAAQPSHDWAAGHPLIDFDVNARGTLLLLEAARLHSPECVFVFLSTNKVYGDAPNELPVRELSTRYDWCWHRREFLDRCGDPVDEEECGADPDLGISEGMRLDQSTHSLFGCSKAAADLYVQEYARYFGMRTCCLRCGCLTGGAHAGAEQHGFLAYLVKCCREGLPYTVHGYKGRQVRDNLHARDVARAAEEFYRSPRPGEVYNLGGGRENSCSVLEAIDLAERATGRRLRVEFREEPRKGDHRVWISDTTKFRRHYPGWSVSVSLPEIFAELAGVPCGSPG